MTGYRSREVEQGEEEKDIGDECGNHVVCLSRRNVEN